MRNQKQFHASVNYLTLQRAEWLQCSFDRGIGIMRTLSTFWLNKGLAVIAMALLISLALTQFARYGSTVANHAAATDAMARGGQFEKALLW